MDGIHKILYSGPSKLLVLEYSDNQINSDNEESLKPFKILFDLLQEMTDIKVIFITLENHMITKMKDLYEIYIDEFKDKEYTLNDLTAESQRRILETNVTFQKKKICLNKFIYENNEELKNLIDSETLEKLINEPTIIIGDKLRDLANLISYYIPRQFQTRTIINKKIIKDIEDNKIPDFFVISGDGRRFANDNDKMYVFNENSHELAKIKFQELYKQNSTRNIHWLKSESDILIWHASHGSIVNLVNYREKGKNDDTISREDLITEVELVELVNNHNIVIISDTAGTGKSTILTYLYQQLEQNLLTSNTWLIRVNLNDYTAKLKDQKGLGSFKEQKIDRVVEFLSDDFSTPFEQKLFKHSVKYGKTIMMFDGFDEISPDYKDVVINLMRTLKVNLKTQLWVTTRPNMQADLEHELEQFAYMLKPFSLKDQEDFLTKFWTQKLKKSEHNRIEINQGRLQIYAASLLKRLAKSINDNENEFTGFPLQIRMLAEVFEKECQEFHNSTDSQPKLPKNLDLIKLYELFVDKKYEIYLTEKVKESITIIAKAKSEKSQKDFLSDHQNLALYTIFNEVDRKILLSEKYWQEFCKEYPNVSASIIKQPEIKDSLWKDKQEQLNYLINNIIPQGKEKSGIIDQIIKGRPHFIHRTFAEYFSANFLANQLTENLQGDKFQEFLLTNILVKPDYLVIRSFLNGQLKIIMNKAESEDFKTFKTFGKKFMELWTNRPIDNDKDKPTILYIAVEEKNVQIIKFLLNILDGNVATDFINAPIKDGWTALHCAARTNQFEVVKYMVERNADYKVEAKNGLTAFHSAAQSGNLDIIKWLVHDKGVCINFPTKSGLTILHLVARSGEVKTVKWLVKEGANIKATGVDGETILHFAAKSGVIEVVQYLVDQQNVDTTATTKDGRTVLHSAAKSTESGTLTVVKYLVEEKKAVIEATTKDGKTVLHFAVGYGMLNVVQYLVREKKANINAKTNNNRTILHSAVNYGNFDIVDFLINEDPIITVKDKNNKTPLDIAREKKHTRIIKLIIIKLISLNYIKLLKLIN